MLHIILTIITILSLNTNIYAENITDTVQIDEISLKQVQQLILDDCDFIEYLYNIGVSEKELKDVLYSEHFASCVEFELVTMPDNDDVIASWSILDWHIKKLENFINYLFTGDSNYKSNNISSGYNNQYNYNNMMPPPPPSHWDNRWEHKRPNTNWNSGYNNNVCNCDCDNCRSCLNKTN